MSLDLIDPNERPEIPDIHPLINDPRTPGSIVGLMGYPAVALKRLAMIAALAATHRIRRVLVVDHSPKISAPLDTTVKIIAGIPMQKAICVASPEERGYIDDVLENILFYRTLPDTPLKVTTAEWIATEYRMLVESNRKPELAIILPQLRHWSEFTENRNKSKPLWEVVAIGDEQLVQMVQNGNLPPLIVCHHADWEGLSLDKHKSPIPHWLYLRPGQYGSDWLLKNFGCGDDKGYQILTDTLFDLYKVKYSKPGHARQS